ncbi:hypothetical protein [Desulfomonile tiedjei]|uniref:CopG-like ribbon-helix-helix domain-containing protein n=1 Tax=Desulfomonile tiedjei (strain ATCC 49306 / DSM 6799 / DCB-1) TaxID=706587 RepID=I4CE26_DESTA|nr:hypothetical protein [Desulfomonile tiedjei]AFM27817.1 hypothetical protein Desti_5220 [Desulfomonile tiedjei DSM 6799]
MNQFHNDVQIEPITSIVTFKLPQSMHNALLNMANERAMSISALTREFVARALGMTTTINDRPSIANRRGSRSKW